MKRIQLKTLSMIAAVSLLLGVAGCKKTQQHKNRISGRIITENDSFYTAELVDMKIPLDESKELVHVQLDSGLISSDMVVFDYSISYEVPQELNARTLDKDQHPENYTAEEAEKIQAEYNSYHENGYVGFDHEGNILFRQTDEGANRSDFFVGPNGELLKLSRPYDEEARKFHTFICEVQRDGSQKNLVELVGKDDYDSAFRSFEIGGKLYHIPVCMDVYGFVGDQRLLGESRILSLSELLEMQGRIEGTTRLFPVYSYEKMLDLLLPGSFSQFLDANSMTMNVTNEEFQSVLKVASVLGADPNPPGVKIHSETGYMAPDDYSPPEEQLQAGLVALIPATISAPEMYAEYLKMLNGNAGVYGMEGGYSVGSDFTLGISKNTKFPKECWDFIRFLFEKEQQIQCAKDFYSIPLYREAAADICEEADLTDMEKSSFMEMLEKAYISRMSNYRIKEIILEEGMAYFKGQKSVEDVCQIIQNRVNTYMKEQYGKGTVS